MFIRLGTPSGFSTMSTGVPSGRNGISSRQDLGDDALVPVASGHLVAFHQLALLGDVDRTSMFMPAGSSSPGRLQQSARRACRR